ncbi:HTRA2-related serine protease isoform X2 [Ptiloglossa arizonensis]|uniref:HTRA2-related serine protease isoform X2 n=1 Tax=Ptiloglossa arizonensis TaxID=3350558 RepID=UPI003F9F3F95
MATLLLSLSWRVSKQNQLQYKQVLILPCTNRFSQYRRFSAQQKNRQIFNKTITKTLTYTIFFAGFGYTFYMWKDKLYDQFSNLNLVPTCYAQSVLDIRNNRDKYNFVADVVEISLPSVVYIEISENRRYDFFAGNTVTSSNGAGFIVESDGLILTNAHVVVKKVNSTIKVRLHNGSIYTGVVEDIDMYNDLATVRINKTNLPVMKLGSSANIRPGEFVVAIGSPLALCNSITSGIVSNVNRHFSRDQKMGFIQTDAQITFGNSGGPLLNLNGEAIGITAMKVANGISFAIPIDLGKEFLKKAKMRRESKGFQKGGNIFKKRYIGVTMFSLTPDLIFELQQKLVGIPHDIKNGVFICQVIADSPAYFGGMQRGDIITHINGKPVINVSDIYDAIDTSQILRITLIRETQPLEINIRLEDV